jgi:hypothetical protein
MNVSDFKFPVICFGPNFCLRIRQDWDSLTITTRAGLKNGLFDHLLIVDSQGCVLSVKNAKKLYGVGRFWGYNIFLNQRIKVELITEDKTIQISVEEVKKYVFKSFANWHGWASRGDFGELKKSVANAKTITEIIQLLK